MRLLKQIIFVYLLCLTHFTSLCQTEHKLTINFNQKQFKQGDTISFEANLKNYESISKTATLSLIIEELKTGRKWKYRYPLINGYINANLKVNDQIQDGVYAFTFLLQKKFFGVDGSLLNPLENDAVLKYFILTKNMQMESNIISLDKKNNFQIRNILFQDSACIIFSRPKNKNVDLKIKIETPLDSLTENLDTLSQFIIIGKTEDTVQLKNNQTIKNYQFDGNDSLYKTIMPAVVVNSKSKKLIDNFEKENTTALFSGFDATIIDGLESNEIAQANDLFTYLTTKAAGLTISIDEEMGSTLMWRKHPTEIYVDEIKVDPSFALEIIPSEIAMIKIFPPGTPVGFGTPKGGAVAVYLKKGVYKKEKKVGSNFCIVGYTGIDAIWK